MNTWTTDQISDQNGRRVLITGATSGIGKEATRVLAGKNASVIIAARNLQKAETVVNEIQGEYPQANLSVVELDLSSLESVAACATKVKEQYDTLDVLINNAGIMMCPYDTTREGLEIQIGTNHFGHFALTGQLLPLLQATSNSRVVNLSSMAHKMGDIDFSDINWESRDYSTGKAYGDSKLANLYFTNELARQLQEKGQSSPMVTAAHPGWTATELQRHSGVMGFLTQFFAQTVDMGALPTLRAGFGSEAQSGDYYGPAKFLEMRGYPIKVEANKLSRDREAAQKLWKLSEKVTGVSYSEAI